MYFVTFLLCDKEQNPVRKIQIHPEKCLKDQLPPFSPEPPSISRLRAQERFPLIWSRCWFKHSAPKIERIRTYGYETPEEATLNNNHEKKQTSLGKKIPQLHCYWSRSSSFLRRKPFFSSGKPQSTCFSIYRRSIVDLPVKCYLSIHRIRECHIDQPVKHLPQKDVLGSFSLLFWVVLVLVVLAFYTSADWWNVLGSFSFG